MTAVTLTRDTIARLRTAGLRLPRVLPGQVWQPSTGAEQHLLSEARRLDCIRQVLLEEIGRLRAQAPSPRSTRQRFETAATAWVKDIPLTAGQLEALSAAAHGEAVEAIARRLHITEETVKSQRKRAIERLGAHNVTHAVALAIAAGWIHMEPQPQNGDAPS